MITEIFLTTGSEHPVHNEADYHFMIDVYGNGGADLLAIKRTGSGWVEHGRAHQLIPATKALARDLSDDARPVVISYAVPDPDLLARNGAKLRRVK